jgi:anaerobic magnesium-protoporphyrin IX monomethyl ester cyclase
MSSVLLTVSNLRSIFGDPNAIPGHPHTGVAYLSAFLKSKGVHVDLYDERMDGFDKLPELLKNNYDLVGITAFSYSLRNVYALIDRIKSHTKAPVVLGGPHVSVSKLQVLKDTHVDFAVKNEGELTALELLDVLKSPKPDFAKVRGLLWRDGSQGVENEGRPLIDDIDSLPYPDYESFGIERYPCWQARSIPFITQRGCPYKCNFCSVPVSMGGGFRSRTPENTVKEMEYWHAKGFRHFQINDDVFNLHPERVVEICKLIVAKNLGITWELYNGMRVNAVNEELLDWMKRAGCRLISYGCESGSPRLLKLIRKGLTKEMVSKAVQLTHKAAIPCSVNFIVGHPTETFEEAKESLRFAASLPASFINFYNDTPYPGTELFEWVKANAQILNPDYLTDMSYNSREPIYVTPEFPKEQRMWILERGRNLYERSVLRYRLGPFFGAIAYFLSRLPAINKFGRSFVTNTKLGHYIFSKFSVKFGGMVWVR